MATRSYTLMTNVVGVTGTQFCSPYPVDLTITTKGLAITGVTDTNGNIMFKLKRKYFGGRRLLLDAAGNTIVSIQQKLLTPGGWQVFRGDGRNSKDFLFSAKRPSSNAFQRTIKLDIFLASNPNYGNVCDFRVEGSWFHKSCTIYASNSSTISSAQMSDQHNIGQGNFAMTVYPNVDHAFIVALLVILEDLFIK